MTEKVDVGLDALDSLLKSAASGSESAKICLDLLERQQMEEIKKLEAELAVIKARNIANMTPMAFELPEDTDEKA